VGKQRQFFEDLYLIFSIQCWVMASFVIILHNPGSEGRLSHHETKDSFSL